MLNITYLYGKLKSIYLKINSKKMSHMFSFLFYFLFIKPLKIAKVINYEFLFIPLNSSTFE